jgi:hypothetical protein
MRDRLLTTRHGKGERTGVPEVAFHDFVSCGTRAINSLARGTSRVEQHGDTAGGEHEKAVRIPVDAESLRSLGRTTTGLEVLRDLAGRLDEAPTAVEQRPPGMPGQADGIGVRLRAQIADG